MENYSSCPGRRNGHGLVFLFLYAVLFPFLAALIFRPRTISCHPNPDTVTPGSEDTDEFYELLKNGVFADKTLLIEDFAIGRGDVIQIIRPPGWGKTTNMKMLRRFLAIELDEKGEPLPIGRRVNRKLFSGGEIDFGPGRTRDVRPSKISTRDHIMNLQGKYPVIYVNFKGLTGSSYREMVNKTKILIANLFRDHSYLKGSLKSEDEENFELYVSGKMTNETELERGLKILSRLVSERFKEDVYIFVDDYDSPLCDLFVNLVARFRSTFSHMSDKEIFGKAFKSEEYEKSFTLFRGILDTCLTNNSVLRKGLLSGTFDMPLPSFENVSPYGLLDIRFSEHYGISQEEVDNMLLNAPFIAESRVVRRWYGYNFTGNATYNPWSIRRFFASKGKFDDYWIRCGNTSSSLADEVLLADAMQPTLHKLVDGEPIPSYMRNKVVFDLILNDVTVLFLGGYLSPYSYYPDMTKAWGLAAPNEEIKSTLRSKLLESVCRKLKVPTDYFVSMAEQLATFKVDQLKKNLEKLLSAFPSDAPGLYYDGIMKSLMHSTRKDYIVETSKEPTNATLISKTDKYANMIFVVYRITDNEKLSQDEAKSGLEQIKKNLLGINVDQYKHTKRVLKISLVFYKTTLVVEHEITDNNANS